MGVNIGNIMQAAFNGFTTGYQAALRAYEDPTTAHQEQSYQWQINEYALLWSYYNGSMFDKVARVLNSYSFGSNGWALYKSTYNLYQGVRLIYNPTKRLVNFYAGCIYPGMLSEDGNDLPDGVPLAIPFSADTPQALKMAIAQFWQWSNWQAKKSMLVRYGSALGDVLVEVVDDIDSGKVCAEIVWPGFVQNLDLDNAGNVKSYTIQYAAFDPLQGSYIFRKDVDQGRISYFKDSRPFDYGNGAVIDNPYGFCPAVWYKHQESGGIHGSPVIAGSFSKIDELNNLASHIHDQIHKVVGAPLVMWSSGGISNLYNTKNRVQGVDTSLEKPTNQESVLMMKGPADGHVDTLAGDLPLADAAVFVDRLIAEIEDDHPELTFYKTLRSMSQLTGPAAQRLVGDVEAATSEAMANYDQGTIKLFQMVCAIGGMRANDGSWGPLNRQQQKFLPFDLDSYTDGDLDMAIVPRPLLKPTKQEQAQEKATTWQGVQMAVSAGLPLNFILKDEGFTDEQLAAMKTEQQAEQQTKIQNIKDSQLLAQEDTIPETDQ